jgi:hypothetical protein
LHDLGAQRQRGALDAGDLLCCFLLRGPPFVGILLGSLGPGSLVGHGLREGVGTRVERGPQVVPLSGSVLPSLVELALGLAV